MVEIDLQGKTDYSSYLQVLVHNNNNAKYDKSIWMFSGVKTETVMSYLRQASLQSSKSSAIFKISLNMKTKSVQYGRLIW